MDVVGCLTAASAGPESRAEATMDSINGWRAGCTVRPLRRGQPARGLATPVGDQRVAQGSNSSIPVNEDAQTTSSCG